MTHTLLLEMPDDPYRVLERTAERTNQTVEETAIQWLTSACRDIAEDPLEKSIGAFRTDIPGWPDRHDDLLGETLMDNHEEEE